MNIVDLILVIGLCWMVFRGCRIGLVRGLVGLVSFILAYGLGLAYGGVVSEWISGQNAGHGPAMLGFVCVFFSTLIACYLFGRMLQAMLKATPLGVVDTLCGGVFGMAQGVLLLGLLILLLRAYPPHPRVKVYIDDARLTRQVQQACLVLMDVFKAGVPRASELYKYLEPEKQKSSIHPFVDSMTRGTGKARAKLKGLIEESQGKETPTSGNPQPTSSTGNQD
jgi:membrane protein required for colicin V production